METPFKLLSGLAHELGTPLNSIRMLAELLAENASGNLGARELRYAAHLKTASGELNRLLEDLSLLARARTGGVVPAPEELEIGTWTTKLADDYRAHARRDDVDLRVDVGSGAPERPHLDVRLLERILEPILVSSIRLSAGGEVRVAVDGSANGDVTVAVTDDGPPVVAGQEEALFEAFRRDHPRTRRQLGGTGLGLTLSRELTRVLGGELRVSTTAGRVIFTLRLPALRRLSSST